MWLKLKRGIATGDKDVCVGPTPPYRIPRITTRNHSTPSTQRPAVSRPRDVCCCVEIVTRGQGRSRTALTAMLTPLNLTPTTAQRNNPDRAVDKKGRESGPLRRALGLRILKDQRGLFREVHFLLSSGGECSGRCHQ